MIGDQLTTDIMFGNLNKMSTVWLYKYKDETNPFEKYLPDLFNLEKYYSKSMVDQQVKFHNRLDKVL